MSRLVFVTQRVDADDPVLGFVTGWIRALARRFDEVVVIATRTGTIPPDLGATVRSLDDPPTRRRAARGVRYQRHLASVCRHRPDALLAHMCPVYLNQAVPITELMRVPRLLWFAHPSSRPSVRLAARMSQVVLTSLPSAFPLDAAPGRVRVIGQAIDIDRFPLREVPPKDDELRLLTLGRTSPVKGLPTIIRAVGRLVADGRPVSLRIVGPATTEPERHHRLELERLVEREGLGGRIRIDPPVTHDEMPRLLASAHALVNATASGSGDKVVFEAMATGRPVVASNTAMRELVGGLELRLDFDEGDDRDLANRLTTLAAGSREELAAIGERLRARVVGAHSLDGWANQVAEVVEELRGRSRQR